jgi:predicted TIM-barrel fold metal-dependent hydrolase
MAEEAWDCHIHVFDGRPTRGHYAPPASTLPMVAERAAAIGVSRFVLVQPSVYGTDNSLLLDALRRSDGRHRGIVVLDADASDESLREMHALGVRGVRFNLLSPVGNTEAALPALAPKLRAMGWHVQWHARPDQLARIAELHDRFELTAVLDHLAGFTPAFAADEALWADLLRVARQGAWIKLSALYRLGSAPPFADLRGAVERAASMFGNRCVWGSDWPHTFFLEPGSSRRGPAYVETWDAIAAAIDDEARANEILRRNPAVLYA